jgi:hypothetical protein
MTASRAYIGIVFIEVGLFILFFVMPAVRGSLQTSHPSDVSHAYFPFH